MLARQRPYHHGKLRQALIDMAVTVAEETGKDLISVREVARRVGVSSGAPFRHFPNRESLMTAVAEEALARLRLQVERDQLGARADPIGRLKTLGRTFIRWALQNPTQFRLVSSRRLFEFERSASLPVHFDAVRQVTMDLVQQAQLAGLLPASALPEMTLALRALVYGLARMQVDGQLPQWRVDNSDAERTLISAMDLVIDGLSLSRPDPS